MTTERKITVRETAGIRRFLYPLSADLELADEQAQTNRFGLASTDGLPIPFQIVRLGAARARIDFAVSLAPHESLPLRLAPGLPRTDLEDPLVISGEGLFRNSQKLYSADFGPRATLSRIVYDGVDHLRRPAAILRNAERAADGQTSAHAVEQPLAAWIRTSGTYRDGCGAETVLELSACKSWVKWSHELADPKAGDRIVFLLPFSIESVRATCDFGVGFGTYARLRPEDEILWRTRFLPGGRTDWSIATRERTDYEGSFPARAELLPRRWFHLIDDRKALAAAVTQIPDRCDRMNVRLQGKGDVAVEFLLGEAPGPARFELCWHFLNDIPAIAAATSPLSILLPPEVEL